MQLVEVVFTVLQVVPHVPQCAGFVSGSAHEPAQQSEPAPGHAMPQTLQLSGSDCVSMQRPLQQLAVPGQVPEQLMTHAPAGLHFFPPVQSPSPAHSTHWWRPRLQTGELGLSATHSALVLQPGAHSFVGRQ
jgi:hypothetical protein